MLLSTDVKPANFYYLMEVICKRLWLSVGVFLVFVALAVLYAIGWPAEYKTTTTILVEGGDSSIPILGRQGISMHIKNREMKDQVRIFKSRTIAERVAMRVGVKDTDALLSMVEVQVPRNSVNVLEMSVLGSDPQLISEIANLWVQEYIGRIMEDRKKTATDGESQVIKGVESAVNDLKEAESRLSAFELSNPGVSEKAGVVVELEKKRLDLENRISEITVKYKEEHPKVAAIKASLENLHKAILEERQRVEKDWDRIQEYERLDSDVKTYRKLYNDLLESSKNLRIVANIMPVNVQIIDKAGTPDHPLSKTSNLLKLMLLGILLSLGSGILAEYLDHSLTHPEEVEVYAKMPVLAETRFYGKERNNPAELYKAASVDQGSIVAEAFRSLKAFLFFAAPDNAPLDVIAVTGTLGREGKTFTASNLAITFAHAGEKTLLVDADMRGSKLGLAFGENGGKGLSDVLAAGGLLPQGIIAPTLVPNLCILPSGKNGPLSADLLGNTKALKVLLDRARADFQRIVIDVPAVLDHPDALYWNDVCDGIVYVIGKGVTSYEKILEAKKKFKKGESKIIGAVLNDVGAEDYIVAFIKNRAGKISSGK